MIVYNRILEGCILPFGDFVTNGSFVKSLKKLRKYDRYSSDDLKSLEHDKLLSVLSHAINSSEFYNNLKISPIDNAYSLLKKFPILEKKTIREHAQGLCTSKNNLIARKSSGSSGFQTTVYINKEEESLQRAYQVHWWEWAGYKIGMPILQTGITPKRRFIKKIKDYLLNTYYLKAFTHDEDSLSKALLWARKQKKVFLGGYASSLYVISQHVNNKKIEASFSGAVSWGDKLFPHYKKNIEKYLNVNVCETYGSSEGFLIAAQKDLQYMYIMSAHVYLEIVDDEGNEVPDGELGHVLVTSLDAYTMPLIRYRIGDLAIKLPRDKYPKKRELAYPLLEKIIGRDTDLVKTRSGKYMVVHSFAGIIEHYDEIMQFCVVQKDLDGIEILYIPSESFHEKVLMQIKEQLMSYLQDENFEIKFKKVGSIEPTKSGKPQIIKSLLKKDVLMKFENK